MEEINLDNLEEIPQEKKKKTFMKNMKTVWNKTVFPDMIKAKKQEKLYQNELKMEAKVEAREQIKQEIKKHYIEEEVNKAKGIKKPNKLLQNLADGFSGGMNSGGVGNNNFNIAEKFGGGSSNFDMGEKIDRMLGTDRLGNNKQQGEKVKYVYVKNKKAKNKHKKRVRVVEQKNNPNNFEEKMKRMLS